MYNISIKFEYDPEKSRVNLRKHGISFEEVKEIWMSGHADIDAKTVSEIRKMVIGPVNGKIYTCVYTPRSGKVRIISARRSRVEEERIYHERVEKKEKDNG